MMTRQAISDYLDACAEDFFTFPSINNGYIYPVDHRLHVMRSDSEWMIIIELLCFYYNYPDHGPETIINRLHLLGSDV